MQSFKPGALLWPEVRRAGDDLKFIGGAGWDVALGGQPLCAAGALAEAEIGIEIERVGVVVADVEPEFLCAACAGALHHLFGDGAGDAAVTVIGMHGHVGDQVNLAPVMPKDDQAGVANDFSILFPDEAAQWHVRGVFHRVHPRLITAGAAHIADVVFAIVIHVLAEAQFDQVCHLWQVVQGVEWAQVGVSRLPRGNGDGRHWVNYKRVVGFCLGRAYNAVVLAGSPSSRHCPQRGCFMDDLLQQGISAFKAGKRDEARRLFIAAVKQNPNSERAWGGMYEVSGNDKERIYCLKQMLRINPNNKKVAQLLNQLLALSSTSTRSSSPQTPLSPKPISSSRNKKSKKFNWIAIAGMISFMVVCCVAATGITFYEIAPTPISETPIPVEKIIEMTFSAAGTQTAASYSPTPLLTSTGTPTAIPIFDSTTEANPTLIVAPVLPSGNSLQFTFINVGQGDATLIRTPDGKTILIDGGETDTGIVSKLQSLGVQRIDLMIATHPHSDHIGGLVQVLQSFPVAKVITSGQPHTTSVYEHFIDGIASAQAEYGEVKRGDVISLGGVDFRILNPVNNNDPDFNENSIVLLFKYGQTTFLMMGDSGAVTEADMLSAGLPLKADILKVGHHGSTSGSTQTFLNMVQPTIALYSAGINNQYGHPALQTIAALEAVGATVYGTDRNGTISINVDLDGYTIKTVQDVIGATPVFPTVIVATITPSVFGGLEIVSVTSPVSKGSTASLTAKTSPNASCSITVYYKSGPSEASGLGPKTADASGMVSWTWKVGASTTAGTWRIVVNCNGVTKETTFTVQ
jgi:competence protein ComEC